MGKGLPRSHAAGPPSLSPIRNVAIDLAGSMDVTGVDSAVDAGTFVIEGLPEGNILFLGAVVSNLVIDATDDDVLINWAGDFGIGTIPNADVDLGDAGDDNIIPSQALLADTGEKVTLAQRAVSTQTEHGLILDNTAGDLELNFNLLIDDNFITDTEDGTFTVSGTLHMAYVMLGDD